MTGNGNPHGIRARIREGRLYLFMKVGRSWLVGTINPDDAGKIDWVPCQDGSLWDTLPPALRVKDTG